MKKRDTDMTPEEKALKEKERKDFFIAFAYALGGLALAVGSFILYHHFSEYTLLTVAVCIVDVIYAYINARIFVKSKDWNGARQLIIPLGMVVYWAIIFAVVAIFNAAALHGEFSNDFFIYPIFLMPAFVIETLVLALFMSGM